MPGTSGSKEGAGSAEETKKMPAEDGDGNKQDAAGEEMKKMPGKSSGDMTGTGDTEKMMPKEMMKKMPGKSG